MKFLSHQIIDCKILNTTCKTSFGVFVHSSNWQATRSLLSIFCSFANNTLWVIHSMFVFDLKNTFVSKMCVSVCFILHISLWFQRVFNSIIVWIIRGEIKNIFMHDYTLKIHFLFVLFFRWWEDTMAIIANTIYAWKCLLCSLQQLFAYLIELTLDDGTLKSFSLCRLHFQISWRYIKIF